jgi:hypothetical protein
MAFSTVLIEFHEVPGIDQQLNLSEDSIGINLYQVFKEFRTGSGEVELPFYVAGDHPLPDRFYGFVPQTYTEAFDFDFNIAGQFSLEFLNGDEYSGIGSVLITANFSGAIFSIDSNSTTAEITITNEVIIPPVNIVTPTPIDFFVVKGITGTTSKPLNITTLSAWTISSSLPSWLSLSSVSGTGDTVVNVIPVAYSAMAVGDYTTTINVTIGLEVFEIVVNLKVLDFIKIPFAPGKIHFSQELDYLKFSSTTPSTYIDFAIEIKVFKINTYEPIIYNRTYKFPLFKGTGNFHIGTIVHDLFEEIQELSDFVPDLKTNYYKSQYRPAEISVSFEEKTFGTTVPGLISLTIPMFKMVKGHKPFTTEGELTLLTVAQQQITRITPRSFIGTSFIYVGSPRIVVKKNNTILEDFTIPAVADKVIYSYFRFINNLKPGDSIEIIIVNDLETRSQRFEVFQNGLENTYFFFENDNQMLESFEFAGRRRVNPNFTHILSKKMKDLHAYESKVKSTILESFIINTGQLGKSDYRLISALVASPNAWCSFDNPQGPYFKVDATTTKLNTQDTSSSEENFDIDFNLLEDPYAGTYPR